MILAASIGGYFVVSNHQGMTQQQIADELDIAQSTVSSTINSIGNYDNVIVSDSGLNSGNCTESVSQGNSRNYLLGRLKRDFPDILDKIGKDKEYKSVRQAPDWD